MSSPKKIKRNIQQHGLEEFEYNGKELEVTPDMKAAYEWDGAIMIRKLFSIAEVEKVTKAMESNPDFTDKAFGVADGTGTSSQLVLWNQPGHDITGMMARVEKVVKTCQELSGGEVYHYHTKLMMKNARTGGKHLWHQDYGYWYNNGCLRPDMMTAFIALDPCTKANGCLQVVPGTQRCGRIEHVLAHGQTQADQERVDELLKYFPKLYVEMQPGDALFFHCNTLHTSDKNPSDKRRWAFLCCYNRADNDPVMEHHHAQYTPLSMVPNNAIMDCKNLTDLSGKDFALPSRDRTIRGIVVDPK